MKSCRLSGVRPRKAFIYNLLDPQSGPDAVKTTYIPADMENNSYTLKQIAHIENDFRDKFGVPRQSGLAPSVMSRIIFEPEFRNADTLRGLEDFSHIWLIWQFSKNLRDDWSPTVRPPKLGGNERVGVFASRSPFRPNALGLSSVKIEGVTVDEKCGPVITVSGADLLNGTPIFDIKPYIPFTDIHTDAKGGFTDTTAAKELDVVIPERIRRLHDAEYLQELTEVLRGDPRPGYHNDPDRIYGFGLGACEVRFRVSDDVITVISID